MCKITHCKFHYILCKITYYVWNKIIQGSLSRSVWKKILSLEKFYTHIVADVADYYQVCSWRPPGPPGGPLTLGMSSWVKVSHPGSLWVIFDPSGVNYSSAYIALFVAKILPNRPVHGKGLRTRVYALTRVRFLWDFVFPVLFGHNLGPLDQKNTKNNDAADLQKVPPFVLLTLRFNVFVFLTVQNIIFSTAGALSGLGFSAGSIHPVQSIQSNPIHL